MATKKFPDEMDSRGTVKVTDKLMIHNIDTGVTEYTTVAELLAALSTFAAGQIGFPAVQNPSADVNTLDDYAEVALTPVLKFGGASVGITYATQTGGYTKIGNRVFFTIRLILTNKGSSVGVATIDGFPDSSVVAACTLYVVNMTFADRPQGFMSGTQLYLREVTHLGAGDNLTDADFTNTTVIYASGNYKV